MAFGGFNSTSENHTMTEINMVPLIDVMLVLLVIFIITAPLLSQSIKINVPQANAAPVDPRPLSIDLAVNDAGQIFLNDQPVLLDDLQAKLKVEAAHDPQPELRIRADLNTRYEVLAHVMSSAKGAGLKRLGFITRPDEAAPAGAASIPAGH